MWGLIAHLALAHKMIYNHDMEMRESRKGKKDAKRSALKDRRAFTMIELILILTLMGALMVFAAVAIWGAVTTFKLDAATAKVISDIRYAQHLARTHNQWYGINFQVDPVNSYNVYYTDGSTDTDVENPADPSTTLQIDVNDEYSGVTISGVSIGSGGKVEFNPIGTPYDDVTGSTLVATGTITLTHGGTSRTIQIYPNTGKVELL